MASGARTRLLPTPELSKTAIAAIAATIIAVIGVLALLAGPFDGSTPSTPKHLATSITQTRPNVPVAVLNATATPGAAGHLAQQLRAREIKIAVVGNVTDPRPPGLWILYAPGARTQATQLAYQLTAQAPRIAPIDPAARAAAGTTPQLVALIS